MEAIYLGKNHILDRLLKRSWCSLCSVVKVTVELCPLNFVTRVFCRISFRLDSLFFFFFFEKVDLVFVVVKKTVVFFILKQIISKLFGKSE